MSTSDSEYGSEKLLYGYMPSAVVAATWRDIHARLEKHKQVLPGLDEERTEGMQNLIDAEQWELDTFKKDYAEQLGDENLSEDIKESSSSESESSEDVKTLPSKMKYTFPARRR